MKVSGSQAKVVFTADDATGLASTECKIDSKPYKTCTSPKTYTGLSRGSHVARVRATDLYDNVGSDKQSFKIS